jgi:hypothetical protein
MRTQQPPTPPPPSRSVARRPRFLALVLALLLTGGVGTFLATRGSDDPPPLTATPPPTIATTTTLNERAEVVSRLEQIFRIRDRAYTTRDANTLGRIYTVDCTCLVADKKIIQEMKARQIVWKGISTSLEVTKTERVTARLWLLTAVINNAPFRIEKESGELVRSVPKGSDLARFALAKPVGEPNWLLGKGSFIRGTG